MQVICPICQREQRKSRCTERGTIATAMAVYRWYDEDGNPRVDDPNTYTTNFTCSNGHEFSIRQRAGQESVIEHT